MTFGQLKISKQIHEIMSKIEWTDKTWNPIIGCSKISEGCINCYAEKMAKRLSGIDATKHYLSTLVNNPEDERYGKWNGTTHIVRSALSKPLTWKKSNKIFVCSMGDLFHESIPFDTIVEVFHIIKKCPQHTFQILTKRPERMLNFFNYFAANPYWENLPNVWLGVTVENQKQAKIRIPLLSKLPASIKYISVEPMLENIDLSTNNNIEILDWVICGGETGAKARNIEKEWVNNLLYQCVSSNIPFFFKSWGASILLDNNQIKYNSQIEGKEYKQFPL